MADGPILKIVYWLNLGAILADQREIWNRNEGSHADIGQVTKTAFFWKFKMADGRHFENSIISISQLGIIRFRSNLVGWCRFQFPWRTFNKNRNFSNSRWRTDAILKIVFWLYLGAILADQREIWNRSEGSHADIDHVTKTAIFENSRSRTAAILKIALSPYLSRELSDFDQIWYTDTNFHSEHANFTKKK